MGLAQAQFMLSAPYYSNESKINENNWCSGHMMWALL